MLRAKDRIIPAMMAGTASGSVITKNTQTGPAPRVLAASSSRRSTASMERRIARTISGKPMTAHASAAPVEQRLSPESPTREHQSHNDARDEARRHGPEGDAQAEAYRHSLFR